MGLNKNSKNDLEGFKAYILVERNFSKMFFVHNR